MPAAFTQGSTYSGVAAEPQNETEMGLALERDQASGIGLCFPVTHRPCARQGGFVAKAAATNSFNPAFLASLAPSDFGGVEIFPVTLRTRDDDGVIEFRTAESNVVFTLAATDVE